MTVFHVILNLLFSGLVRQYLPLVKQRKRVLTHGLNVFFKRAKNKSESETLFKRTKLMEVDGNLSMKTCFLEHNEHILLTVYPALDKYVFRNIYLSSSLCGHRAELADSTPEEPTNSGIIQLEWVFLSQRQGAKKQPRITEKRKCSHPSWCTTTEWNIWLERVLIMQI